MYEVSLPWAIQRSLSPSSKEGIQALRNTLLEDGSNRLDWRRLEGLLADVDGKAEAGAAPAPAPSERRQADPMGALSTVLGMPEGAPLRRIAKEVDSTTLFRSLVSKDGRQLRRLLSKALGDTLEAKLRAAKPGRSAAPERPWPSSVHATALKRRQAVRNRQFARRLFRWHAKQQVVNGLRGAVATLSLVAVMGRVVGAGVVRAIVGVVLRRTPRAGGDSEAPAADGPADDDVAPSM